MPKVHESLSRHKRVVLALFLQQVDQCFCKLCWWLITEVKLQLFCPCYNIPLAFVERVGKNCLIIENTMHHITLVYYTRPILKIRF